MIKRRRVKFVSFLDLKDKREPSGYFFGILIVLSYILVILTFPLSLCFCLKVRIFIYINKNEMNFFFLINQRLYKNMNELLYFDSVGF
jgi:hypothetical protein